MATLAGSLKGKTEGDRGPEIALKDGSPCGVGGVLAVPGPRRVPGLPGFPARGASGRVAATPPSPSERSAAAGPNYRFHQGEAARCGSWRPLGSARFPRAAAARPGSRGSQRPSAVLSRAAASQTFGLALARRADPLLHAGWHSLQSVGAGLGPRPVHSAPRRGREPVHRGWGHLPRGRGEGTVHHLRAHFLPAIPDSAAQAEFIRSFLPRAPRKWEKTYCLLVKPCHASPWSRTSNSNNTMDCLKVILLNIFKVPL